jgi:tRNA-dihydrouridine synthase
MNGHTLGGVLVGRGALRNPWIFAQAARVREGQAPVLVSLAERGQFLLDYIDLLLAERVSEDAGFRHTAPGHHGAEPPATARGRERWVINKLRALGSWYTKGLVGGGELRVSINSSESIGQLRETIADFFLRSNQPAVA